MAAGPGRKGETLVKKCLATVLACLILTGTAALAAGTEGILGTWATEGAKSQVEIFRCADRICARIVSLKEPAYLEARDGPVGTTKTDRKNPDPARRGKPILGLQIMEGFTPTGEGSWGNGTIYDPVNGKTYRCKAELDGANRLKVRGFIGIALIGRTTVWTR